MCVSPTKCNSINSNVIVCIEDRRGGRRKGIVDEDGDGAPVLLALFALEHVNVVQALTANFVDDTESTGKYCSEKESFCSL